MQSAAARLPPGVSPEHGARVSQIQQLIATPPVSLIRVSQPSAKFAPLTAPSDGIPIDSMSERRDSQATASRASVLSLALCESRSLRSSSVALRRNRDCVSHCIRLTSNISAHSARRAQARTCALTSSPKIQASQSGVAVFEEVKSATQIHDGSWRQFVGRLRHRCREPETSLPPRG
jgi:hypothetical protein